MSEQIASITLRADVSDLKTANTELDKLSDAAAGAAAGADSLADAAKRVKPATQQGTEGLKEQQIALKGLLENIDPVTKALNRLDEQHALLVSHLESGRINSSQFEHFNGILNETRQRLTTVADVLPEALTKQQLAAQRAGISVGQYTAALRTLPAQFTDIATQLAGGQSPFLILLQQGGQIKDQFGGFGAMFQALRDALFGFDGDVKKSTDEASTSAGDLTEGINSASDAAERLGQARGLLTPLSLTLVGLAAAAGMVLYSFYQGNSLLSDFNRTLVLSGNSAGLTADRMLAVSRSAANTGMTFSAAAQTLSALVKAGVAAGANFDQLTVTIANFADKSGIAVDDVAKAFGRLTSDPTKGLIAMAQQFHNVTAEQVDYVAQLQRSGDAVGALKAANDAASQGFDKQTHEIEVNMGTLQRWANSTGDAFKGMWDSLLDIGRPRAAADMLASAQRELNGALANLETANKSGFSSGRIARYQQIVDSARASLDMAQQQADLQASAAQGKESQATAQREQLRYTDEANAAYKRSLTPLQALINKQNELNKALKDRSIRPDDYTLLMKDAQKTYDQTQKKPPKTPAVKVAAGDRSLDTYNAETLALQAQLKVLQQHTGVNDVISQQRKQQWEIQAKFSVLEDAAKSRTLTKDEQSLLATKDKALAQAEINAGIGDQIASQQKLNSLADQANKFADQQVSKQAEIDAAMKGQSAREAERAATLQRLKDTYSFNPDAQRKVIAQQKETYAAEDKLRGSWQAGARRGWSDYLDSATDTFSAVRNVAGATLTGLSDMMTSMVTTGTASFKSFTVSILKMIANVINQLLVAYAVQAAMGWMSGSSNPQGGGVGSPDFVGPVRNAKGGVYQSAGLHQYANGVYDSPQHFTFQGATKFAKGGVFGEAGPEAIMPLTRDSAGRLGVKAHGGNGAGVALSINTTINIDANGNASSNTSAGGDAMGRALAKQINDQARMVVLRETAPNGIIFNYMNKR